MNYQKFEKQEIVKNEILLINPLFYMDVLKLPKG